MEIRTKRIELWSNMFSKLIFLKYLRQDFSSYFHPFFFILTSRKF